MKLLQEAWVKFVKLVFIALTAPFLLMLYVVVLLIALLIPKDKET